MPQSRVSKGEKIIALRGQNEKAFCILEDTTSAILLPLALGMMISSNKHVFGKK